MTPQANKILGSMIDAPVPSIEDDPIQQEKSTEIDDSPTKLSDAEEEANFPPTLPWTLFEIGCMERCNRIEYIQSQAAVDAALGRDSRVSKYARGSFPEIFRFATNLKGEAAFMNIIHEGRKGIDTIDPRQAATSLIYCLNCLTDSVTRAIARAITFNLANNRSIFTRNDAGLTESEGLTGKDLRNLEVQAQEEARGGRLIEVCDEEMLEHHARAALKWLIAHIRKNPVVQHCLNVQQPVRLTRRSGKVIRQQTALFISEANRWDEETMQFVPVSLDDLVQPQPTTIVDVADRVTFDKDTMLF